MVDGNVIVDLCLLKNAVKGLIKVDCYSSGEWQMGEK